MYTIKKITSHHVVDYAAEELKKYLRMMMPDGGDIAITYDPDSKDGFRLGLMQDFSLDVSDAENVELDDILYIDTDDAGGIIAGDNPRSVLLSVYEYLRQNGCRWLFPGVDGEYIPVRGLVPVTYRHKPSCRYRGQCNEGSEYQSNILEAIEFTPKVGLNVFMLEFLVPTPYYNRYYNHVHNEMNRPPEPIPNELMVQWKRQCEAEIAKRGLQFHDVGHGWSADPFGIDSSVRDAKGENDKKVSFEARQYLALVNGERKLVRDTPNYTNFCMSNEEARAKVVSYAVEYAQKHRNVDYLHLWLGDSQNNHCECEACAKKTPSDWYMILLNELDEALQANHLDTRIVFISYLDTIWAPETECLENPDRFTLLFAPISRSYTQTVPAVQKEIPLRPYVRNRLTMPVDMDENLSYFEDWKKVWKGACFAYEYHFWRHQYFDLGGIRIAKLLNEDVKGYLARGIHGIVQDGSQRSFFPTGLAFYTYARTLYDTSLSFEEIAEDYFAHAFGADWKVFYEYLERLGDAFDFGYMEGEKSSDLAYSRYYNPEHVASLQRVADIVAEGREHIASHYNSFFRPQTVSVRLLEFHARFAELLAGVMIQKAQGNNVETLRLFDEMKAEVGKSECYFEPWYDHGLAFICLQGVASASPKKKPTVIY